MQGMKRADGGNLSADLRRLAQIFCGTGILPVCGGERVRWASKSVVAHTAIVDATPSSRGDWDCLRWCGAIRATPSGEVVRLA